MAQGRFLTGVVVALAAGACRTLPPGAECWSLDGRALTAPALPPERVEPLEADLAAARAALAAAPADRDAVVSVARRLGYLGRFREAIDVLTRGLADHPDDAFLLRHRGHRWLTLREFGQAIADLERAARACRTTPDEVEPDGRPTPGRPPHGTLHYNVYYHLGLAHFLAGDFGRAERAWLACLAIARHDEARVAVTHWLWCARVRLGDFAGAEAVVAGIRPDLDVVENRSYHQLCRLYAGQVGREQLAPGTGSAGSALAFGLAHHDLVADDLVSYRLGAAARAGHTVLAAIVPEHARARQGFEALAREPGWPAFGVIAAEVELARWQGGP